VEPQIPDDLWKTRNHGNASLSLRRFRVRYLKYFVLLAAILALPTLHSQAQVSIGVQIGPTYGIYNAPPVCEYGFYPDYPFACAPYGYWGPNYFVNGVFIGVGPWNNFYFTHPTYYRPFYFNRGFRGGYERFGRVEHFSSPVERFHGERIDRGFRSFNEPRIDHDHGFDRGRGFNEARGFRGDDRGYRGGDRDNRGMGGRGPSYGGGNGHRGPEGRGGSSNGGRSYHGGGESHGGGGNRGGRR
jgi:hypothetical protein